MFLHAFVFQDNSKYELIIDYTVLNKLLERVELMINAQFLKKLVNELSLLYESPFFALVVSFVFELLPQLVALEDCIREVIPHAVGETV